MRSLTDAFKAQLFQQESSDPFLLLVTMEHDSFSSPIRFVNNSEDVTSRGNVYSAFPIKITLPTDDSDSVPNVTMTMDNVSLELIDELRTITDYITVSVEGILASLPDFVEIGYNDLKLKGISVNSQTIAAKLFFDDFLSTSLPSESYDPTNFNGIF